MEETDRQCEGMGNGPEEAPPAPNDTRGQLAAEFLRGSGVEIGAMNWPLAVPADVHVTYVDHMSVEDQRAAHPELRSRAVDVIDDGERLETFAEESVDFIVANHFMEHTEDPIGTIETHLSKLRPGGILFYAVPDKRYTFDFRRPRTTLEHLIADYERGPEASRWEHFLEWERMVYEPGTAPPDEEQVRHKATEDEATGYSIHFHVWTQADLLELLLYCQERFGSFEIEAFTRRSIENIVVLRKHGAWVPATAPETASTAPAIAGRLEARDDGPRAATDGAVRLSALRMTLDDGSGPAAWPVGVEGIEGRALAQVADAPVSFELVLASPARFSAEVRLGDHDWRDLRGSVRPWVAVVDASGAGRRLWSGVLDLRRRRWRAGGAAGAMRAAGVDPDAGAGVRPAAAAARTTGEPGVLGQVRAARSIRAAGGAAPRRRSERQPGGHITRPRIAGSGSADVLGADPRARSAAGDARGGDLVGARPVAARLGAVPGRRRLDRPRGDRGAAAPRGRRLPRPAAPARHARRDRLGDERGAGAGHAADYVAMLDHDDLLEPDALERVAGAIAADPGLEMLYSDEDVVA